MAIQLASIKPGIGVKPQVAGVSNEYLPLDGVDGQCGPEGVLQYGFSSTTWPRCFLACKSKCYKSLERCGCHLEVQGGSEKTEAGTTIRSGDAHIKTVPSNSLAGRILKGFEGSSETEGCLSWKMKEPRVGQPEVRG